MTIGFEEDSIFYKEDRPIIAIEDVKVDKIEEEENETTFSYDPHEGY